MNCKICNSPIDADTYITDIKKEMLKHQMCFSCNFWRNRLEEDAKLPPHTWCVINGTHYVVGDEDSKDYFRGFGGREFHIKFNDGTIITTTNLWCQGEPEGYWREKFPDNAVFLNGEQWKQIGSNQYLIGEEIPDRLIAFLEYDSTHFQRSHIFSKKVWLRGGNPNGTKSRINSSTSCRRMD